MLTPFDLGMMASKAGLPLNANPYATAYLDARAFVEWKRGWLVGVETGMVMRATRRTEVSDHASTSGLDPNA